MNRKVRAIVMAVLGLVAALSIGGVLVTGAMGVFGDKYDLYGELPIPGSGEIALPAGEVMVSFHVRGYGGRGLTVPPLKFNITPPPGGVDPTVTEDLGGTISVNDDARRQVWVMQVPAEGVYRVTTGGTVSGFVNPRMAFGQSASMGAPVWVFVALSIVSVDLLIAAWWFGRRRTASTPAPPVLSAPADPYVPTGDGVRLEQLKTIAALRDSGALTEKEFAEEKRRILRER